MILDKEQETMPRDELEKLQLVRLKETVERCYNNVESYKKSMDAAGVKPSDIQTLADITLLPFTEKDQLRASYPFGMFAVPQEDIVRVHASSGTTGKPTVVAYTKNDIKMLARLMARSLHAGGTKKTDRVHNAYGYGLFTGGLGVHYGSEELGSMITPMSGGQTLKQLMLIKDFEPDTLCCTPSYALNLVEAAEHTGFDIKNSSLKHGLFGAEPWTEEMRTELEARLGIDAVDLYGLSEVMGPGVAVECVEAKNGLHIFEDHFLVECIDGETGEVLPYGEEGEIVFTSLTKEAFPILRYRTRDISVLNIEPCECGRTHVRLKRITGRSDDMLIIRGVNVYPSQVESVLVRTEGLSPFYQLEVYREGNMDTMTVNAEATPELVSQGEEAQQAVAQKIKFEIKQFIGVTCTVNIKGINEVPRSEGKAVRVVDHRK